MYSLNVSDLHRPVFLFICTYILIYAVQPPPGYEIMVVYILYLNYFHYLYIVFSPSQKNSDTKQSNFSLFFLRCTNCLPIALTRFKYGSSFVSWYMHEFCVRYSDSSFSVLLPLHPWFICPFFFSPNGAGFLPCIYSKKLYSSSWIVAFDSDQTSFRITLFLTVSRM